jgi:hypoxanthine-guanine phosphoribosyltransferase
MKNSKKSLFGKPADDEMAMDTEHWRRVVSNSYLTGLGIDWEHVRNVMDMNARFGG